MERLRYLWRGYLQGSSTEMELVELKRFVDDPINDEEIKELLLKSYEDIPDATSDVKIDIQYKNWLLQHIVSHKQDKSHESEQGFRFPRAIAIVATICIILFAAILFYLSGINTRSKSEIITKYGGEIHPATSAATLTLSDGRQIKLDDAENGEIARESGIIIKKSKTGQVVYEILDSGKPGARNELSTAAGETYMVTLPDNSKVWMNAASTLTYATNMNSGKTRNLKLSGEAYFEIAKDPQRPFVVETRGQTIEVLGTHFNVNAYFDEKGVKTSLLEGSIRVTKDETSKEVRPGEQAISNEKGLSVGQADMTHAIAWKNNDFLFNDDIYTIMRQIARWYDVDVEYQGTPPSEGFYATISRSKNLSEVLKALELTDRIHFKIEGRRVIVMK